VLTASADVVRFTPRSFLQKVNRQECLYAVNAQPARVLSRFAYLASDDAGLPFRPLLFMRCAGGAGNGVVGIDAVR